MQTPNHLQKRIPLQIQTQLKTNEFEGTMHAATSESEQ